MKTKYCTILLGWLGLMSCLPSAFGQSPAEKIELSSAESGNKTYIARESIRLKPGFSYKSTTGNAFAGKIDQFLVFPPSDNTYQKDDGTITTDASLGAMVGNLSGAIDVSPSGAATYTVPVECPPGIQGMQSNISLVYNSQAGNGIAGWGFNIAGLSAITRVPNTIYSDGTAAGIRNISTDSYALDGNRLVHISGLYGSNNSIFHTETETFIEVTAKRNNSQLPQLSGSVDWFEVQAKDGTMYKYGSNSGRLNYTTSSVQAWMLDSVKNANGQTIVYEYEHLDLYSYIKKITYGSNIIEFSYESRTDSIPIHFYLKNGKVGKRLSKIEIKSNGTLLRKYELKYKYDIFSRLEKITVSNGAGEYLNPVVFEWGNYPTSTDIASSEISIPSSTYKEFEDQYYMSADINGDGITDLFGIFPYEKKTGNYTEYYTMMQPYIANKDINGSITYTTSSPYYLDADINIDKNFQSYTTGNSIIDLDGDGKQSILFSYFQNIGGPCQIGFIIAKDNLNGTRFGRDLKSCENPIYAVGDVNNDGKTEIIYIEKVKDNVGYPGEIVFFNNGTINAVQIYLKNASNKPEKIFIEDFNGDGMKDIFIVTKSGYHICLNRGGSNDNLFPTDVLPYRGELFNSDYSLIQLGDFNGDGLPDFIVNEHCNANWHLVMNNGDGTFTKTKSNVISNLNIIEEEFTDKNDDKDLNRCFVLDFDGDGKSDIILNDAVYDKRDEIWSHPWGVFNRHYVHWLHSIGNDFSLIQTVEYDKDDARSKYFAVGNFNGKGRPELIFYGFDCSKVQQNNTTKEIKWRLYANPDFTDQSGKITAVNDGMKNRTTLEYASLTDNSVYTKQTNAAYPVLDTQVPLYAVKKLTSNAGTTSENTTQYTYKGAKIHLQGKGFLGFNEVSANNSFFDRKTTVKYGYNTTYYYPYVTEQNVSTSSGTALSTTVNSNTHKVFSGKRIFPYMDSQTVTDKLTKTSAKTETSGYDDYGNPSTQKTTRGGLTETQTFHYIQKGSWCLNKPDSIKTVRTISGDSQTRIAAFEYDSKGNLTKEIIHPADTNKVVTEYKNFDGFGNPRTVEVTANSKKRSSSMTYTSSGRFVKTKTNVLGETTTYDWDETKSRLNYESDYQSRKTSYQYDNWGRLILTTYPDGIRSAQVLQWAGNKSGKPDGAKYYSYSETSGAPPVIAWYDGLGRELRTESYGLNRKTIWADTEYNSKGQVQTAWEPYFSNETKTNKTTYKYDRYGRDSVIVTPMGTTSYVYSDTTVTVTTPTDVVQTKTNAAGWTISQKTNGKTVTFTHYASGQVKTATPDGGTAVSMEYDLQGNRTKLIDPDAGTILSAYNGFGELLWTNEKVHTTGDSIITSYDYLASGLLNYKLRSTEKTNYRYDNKNRLSSISISGKHAQGFTYDKYDRIIQANDTVDGSKIFVRQTEYDALGRIKKEIYPGGYYATNEYETYGYLKKVTDSKGSLIWEATESNARGQLTKTKSGNKETTFGFDSRGFPTSILTSGIINQAYLFNSQGNLSSREDKLTGYKETFEYNSNRLSGWSTWKDGLVLDYKTIDYNSTTGNMNSKSGLSNMKYGENSKPPHALTSFTTSSTDYNNSQNIQYTDFRKVKKITEWGDILNIYYGVDEQRVKSDWVRSTGGTQVKYYMGNYEEENNSGVIRKIHYICGGNGLAAVYVQNGNNDTLYYAHTDYLGSLTALSLPNGTVVERYAYDPWGNRRNPGNWTQTDTRTKFILDRGYTMHEHLTAFKLINMNGRVYDPVTAQFLSPDPRISYPGNWLNYNRYQYGLNNPFKYTDPTGEFPWIPLLFYAFQSGIMQGAMSQINGDSFWSGFAQGAAISVGSSLLTFGVGQVFGHALGGIGTELARAGAHSLIGGGVSALQGGNFWQGAAISGLSSLAGSGMQAMGWGGDYLPLVTGAVGAGTAWAVGGDPLSGFMQGYGVGALNHKGEKFVADDGTIGEYSCDDAVITPKPYRDSNGNMYIWSLPLGFYLPMMGERGLETVYPEFDVLMIGRAVYNAFNWAANSITKGGNYSVYQGLDAAGKTRYVGITGREPAIRFTEHATSGTVRSTLQYRVVKGSTGLTSIEARIMEQNLINRYGLQKNGGMLFNKINSISSRNWGRYNIY